MHARDWEHVLMMFFISMCISQYQIVFPFGITHAINVRDEAEADSRIIDDFS